MADILVPVQGDQIKTKMKDMGDGTHAPVVYAEGAGGGSSGTALTDAQLRASPVGTKDTNGEGAVTYITNTTPVTDLAARQVMCLTDTVFATFTRTGATGSITGVSLPAGTLLTGPVTAITLTSGAVAAYA